MLLLALACSPPLQADKPAPARPSGMLARSAPIWSDTTTILGAEDRVGNIMCALGDVDADGYPDLGLGGPTSGDDKGALGIWYGGSSGYAEEPSSVIWGAADDDEFASACAGGGDLNGDGYDDVAIAEAGTAIVRVYLGSAAGLSETAASEYSGTASFGTGVALIHDIDGDGYDELGVADPDAGSYGEAYIYYGSAAGPDPSAGTTLSGALYYSVDEDGIVGLGDVNGDGYGDVLLDRSTDTRWYAGSATGLSTASRGTLDPGTYNYSVARAGDVDGDGYGDVVLGNADGGDAYVYYGSPAGLVGPSSVSGTTSTGACVASAGDVDDDGYDDVLVTYNGGAYVYFGTSAGLSSSGAITLTANAGYSASCTPGADADLDGYADVAVYQADGDGNVRLFEGGRLGTSTTASATLRMSLGQRLGRKIASGMDLNADGYGDIVAGGYDPYSTAGGAYVYFGGAGGVDASTALFLEGENEDDDIGDALDAGGDLDGDGNLDVVMGGAWTDHVQIHYGSTAGPSTTADLVLSGTSGTSFGYALDVVGDLDADGYDDLVVGIPDQGTYGQARVYFGDGGGISSSTYTTISASASHRNFGIGVGSAGDADGDGFAEVVVFDDYTGIELYEGTATGLATTATLTLTSSVGYEWQPGGDINGDGYTDSLTGASSVAYVYFGSATGLSATDYDRILAPSGLNSFADEVQGIGDVDEDGYDDVAVSSVRARTYVGGVYVYPGGASGFGSTALFTASEGGNSEAYGGAIGGPTDVDGDGLLDLVVGAQGMYGGGGGLFLYTGGGDADGDGYDSFADCDDADATISPAARELCDAGDVDEDCDGASDDADASVDTSTFSSFYADVDGDGYGDAASVSAACDVPTGSVANADDCDDANAGVRPGTTEVCDVADVDEDCDGAADDADPDVDPATRGTFYADVDLDGYGDAAAPTAACDAAAATVTDATDCDDAAATVNPAAGESCDSIDNDCDGEADEAGATGEATSYADRDADGYGEDGAAAFGCAAPDGYVAEGGDCDDGDPDRSPAATETCNSLDDDCDGSADEAGAVGEMTTYADADGDGWGDAATAAVSCEPAGGRVERSGDCDDANASRSPEASEMCATEWDDDCDGDTTGVGAVDADTWYADADGDGHGNPYVTARACAAPEGYVAEGDDCDDTDPALTTDCEGDTDTDADAHTDTDTDTDTGPGGRDTPACGCGVGDVSAGALPFGLVWILGRRRARSRRS